MRMRAVRSATIHSPVGSAANAGAAASATLPATKDKTNARNELRSRIAICPFLLIVHDKRLRRRTGSRIDGMLVASLPRVREICRAIPRPRGGDVVLTIHGTTLANLGQAGRQTARFS